MYTLWSDTHDLSSHNTSNSNFELKPLFSKTLFPKQKHSVEEEAIKVVAGIAHCEKFPSPYTAISKHEFLSKFLNCPLAFCSHLLYYAIQALRDIFQCSLCIQRMWIPVSKNKFIWGTNYIQLHYWLRRTSGAIFFLEIRISMAADVGL